MWWAFDVGFVCSIFHAFIELTTITKGYQKYEVIQGSIQSSIAVGLSL